MDNIWEKNLNHLGNIAIYIIRQDTHEILYFNKKVKEIIKEIEIGKKYHELWKEIYDSCPLLKMENEETNTITGYNEPFGKQVTTSVTKIEWGEEKVPAILISKIPMNPSEIEKDKEKALQLERTAVYDSLPGAVLKIQLGKEIIFLEGNHDFYDMFGTFKNFKKNEAYGIYPEDKDFVFKTLYDSSLNGSPIMFEHRIWNHLGEIKWVRCEGKFVGIQNGYPIYVLIVIDITKQKLVQIQLEEKQMEYQLAMEHSYDIMFEYFPNKDLFISHESNGLGKGNVTIENCVEQMDNLQFVHPEDINKVRKILQSELHMQEIRLRVSEKEKYIWYFVQAAALKKDGKIEKVIGTMRNINMNKKQEHLFNATLNTLIGNVFQVAIYVNLTSKTLILEKTDEKKRSNFLKNDVEYNKRLLDQVHPKYRKVFYNIFNAENLMQEFNKGKKQIYFEGLKKEEDNQYHWISVEAVNVGKNEVGEPMALILISNIDNKRKMEQQYEIMATSILTMYGELIIVDLEKEKYQLYKVDEATDKLLDQQTISSFSEVIYRYQTELIHPEDRKLFYDFFNIEAMREKVKRGKFKFSLEVRRKNGTGEYHWCEMTGIVIERETDSGHDILLAFRDIQELKEAKLEKEKADKRFVAAVNNFYDAIYEYNMLTHESVIWKIGKGYPWMICDGIKHTIEDIFNMDYVCEEYREQAQRFLNNDSIMKAFETGETELLIELPFLGNDNLYHWFAIQLQLLEKEEQIMRVMIYIKDTDYMKKKEKLQQDALKDALALAEMSNSAKSEFLSRMSHDIRTPMNAIMGMATIAKANLNDPEKLSDCINKIGISTKFLLALINDVLDMAKIESGKLRISKCGFNLYEMIKNLNDLCNPQAKEHNKKLLIEIEKKVEKEYIGDELRINQVLLNLLGNGVKYTRENGTIQLLVDIEKESNEVTYLRFKVKDNGIGMSKDFLNRLFEPFEQENENKGRVFEGSGLGLSITQNLVHLMNGNITVESKLGEGTEFTIILPLERLHRVEEVDSILAQISKLGKEVKLVASDLQFHEERILLVEDSELNREIAQTLMEMRNLEVETAENGEVAVKRFEQAKEGYYSAVLMDIRMPVMDGLEATKQIRNLQRTDSKTIPIIAMTANAFQEERREARKIGITEYLTKPIEIEKLYQVLYQQIY